MEFRHCERSEAISSKIPFKIPFKIQSKIPSLRGVSETNDEAISSKIPSKIPKPCVIPRLDRGISS